jgi:hypothetical protein
MESIFVNIYIYILLFLIKQTTKNNKEYTVDIYLLKQDIQQCDALCTVRANEPVSGACI